MRAVMAQKIKSGEIKPRQKATTVFKMLEKLPECAGVECDDLFKERLSDLRKKQAWQASDAKKYLSESLRKGTLKVEDGVDGIWQKVKGVCYFQGMECDDTWKRRLKALFDNHEKKSAMAAADEEAVKQFRLAHPIQPEDAFGNQRWDGSQAQKDLREDMANGRHELPQFKGKPSLLWASRQSYRRFTKRQFRDHIYQEKKLTKFLNYWYNPKDKPDYYGRDQK